MISRPIQVLVALAAAAVLTAEPVLGQSQIVVERTASVSVVPDRATLEFEVRTDAETARAAADANAPLMERVIAALRDDGIARNRISTRNYYVSPQYRYEAGVQSIIGYRASNTIVVLVDSVSTVARAIDTGLNAGATSIRTVRFEASDYDAARRDAMQRAVALAREDAAVLARAAGGELGELLEVAIRPARDGVVVAAARMEAAPLPPISVGEQSISVTIEARWRLK